MANDPEDLDLERQQTDGRVDLGDPIEDPPPVDLAAGRRPWSWAWVAIPLIGLVLALGGSLWLLRPGPAPFASPAAPGPSASATPSSSPPPPLVLRALDGSDAMVRELAAGLSTHALFALALGQKELIRTFAALVSNVAGGESPRAHLGFLAPKAGFLVIERPSGRLLLDPASCARYDAVGAAAATLDPESCARVYRLLEPLFDAAYRELGQAEGPFSQALQAAIGKLLEVPVIEGELPLVRVERPVVLYEYFDERLEALSVPQKHLLRMGPENVSRVQGTLRAFALALGPPSPSPSLAQTHVASPHP
jgi:hypothetical protein